MTSRTQPKSESAHTPTPWVCRGQSVYDTSEHTVSLAYCGMVAGAGVCKDGKIRSFGVDQETANANAAFIIEAVNSHATLKARIQYLEDALKKAPRPRPTIDLVNYMDWYFQIRGAALQPKDTAK